MTEKRLTWKEDYDKVYHAYNDSKELLGYLQYERVGAHMHWCWYQMDMVNMSPGCLQEVRDKQKELLKVRNNIG